VVLPYDVAQLSVVTARCFGALAVLPGGDVLSVVPRLLLAVLLAAVMQQQHPDTGLTLGPAMLLRELGIGAALALPCRFAADIGEMLGELLDTARGQTVSSILDPMQGQAFSDLSAVLRTAFVAAVVHCGGLRAGCVALQRSYAVIPAANSVELTAHGVSEVLLGSLPRILLLGSEALMVTGVWLGAFVLIDVVAGLCARTCQGLSFATLSHLFKFLALMLMAAVVFDWSFETSFKAVAQAAGVDSALGQAAPSGMR
jgi:type III secretory pathway component EscT